MVTLTAFTAFGPYFDKRMALSLGITSAGSGILTIIVPYILRMFFDTYTFSGAVLLYGELKDFINVYCKQDKCFAFRAK